MVYSKLKQKVCRRLGLEHLVLHESETQSSREESLKLSDMSNVRSPLLCCMYIIIHIMQIESIELQTDYSEFREELLDD